MDRRVFLTGLCATVFCAQAAQAETAAEAVSRQLRGFGYGQIKVSRTWLGRVRITAERGKTAREIVIDPRTGEVLRDLSTDAGTVIIGQTSGSNRTISDSSSGAAGDSSSGGGDDGGHDSSDSGGSDGGHDSGDSGSSDGGDDD
jgi:hypothetical protein